MSGLPPGFVLDGAPAAPSGSQPSLPASIPGRPKPVAPPTPLQVRADVRADEDQAIQRENTTITRDNTDFTQAASLRDDYNRLPEVRAYRVAVQQLDQALRTGAGAQSDLALTYAFAKAMDPESVVRESETQTVTASQPWFQAAVERAKKEFGMDEAGNFTPQAREAIRQQIINAAISRRQIYDAKRKFYTDLAGRYQFDPMEIIGADDGEAYLSRLQEYDRRRKEGDNPFLGLPGMGDGNGEIDTGPGSEFRRQNPHGYALPTGDIFGNGDTIVGYLDPQYEKNLRDELAREEKLFGKSGAQDLLNNAATASFGDEISGLLGGVGSTFRGDGFQKGYERARDKERIRLDMARTNSGGLGTAAEIIGGIGAFGPGSAPNSLLQSVRGGATAGGIYGFGSGEGVDGSLAGGLAGAATGGALGYIIPKGIEGIGRLRGARSGRLAQQAVPDATEVAAAGTAEGVTVNRAMVDASAQPRVTGVDASMVGGPRLRRGMDAIEGQIEGRVNALAPGGTPMNTTTAGQVYQRAGERFIKDSGREAGALYTRAERMAGDAKVVPTTSLQTVDDAIARLKQTPETFKSEIGYLESLRSDLSGELSVSALRRLRTTLRKKVTKGDLVFGEDEARVLGIMDAAADDIRNGLQQQGNGRAAAAFDRADRAYRDRMEYITGTLQKIIGKRGANRSAEEIAASLAGISRGKDTEGTRKFLATLAPDERLDVQATIAESLGRNRRGDFTPAQFLSQTSEKAFPQEALRIVFGDEGAASIRRLRSLAKEVDRVTGAMNSRSSNTAVANNYRSWIATTLLGAAPGMVSGSGTGALVGAAVPAAASAARDVIGARALLSNDISKWIASAPATANPRVIDRHFARLGEITGAHRMDAAAIQQYLMGAAGASPTRAAAQDESNGRRIPPQ